MSKHGVDNHGEEFVLSYLLICKNINTSAIFRVSTNINLAQMARRGYSDKHTIPENPSWVEFLRSDGDQSLWPQNTTREVDSDGQVNYMRPVPLDEPGPSHKWRVEIASALAKALSWPGTVLLPPL